ncbi:unnamed protein product [Rotaria sp. Silwood2]|nr:unnamed protein product [Rotaria sp. Silwood2]CAF2972906.1 unnamed protein product [Rotaria sp. Silwood2]CAF3962290.1 unnamed protein product [Rotaria sp. Silwood2]CAF4205394.1 unnamed protein product [Rotaria sp. Silwood2]
MEVSSRDKIRDFLVIWLDTNACASDDHAKSCEYYRAIVHSMEIFSDPDACIDFVTDRDDSDERVFLILSESFSENIVPFIHTIPQLHSIYIHGSDGSKKLSWTNEYEKVRGQIWNNLLSIGEQLKKDTNQCRNEFVAISFVSQSEIAAGNRQDPSFMYTQLLKEILLKEYQNDLEEEAQCQMINFWRTSNMNNETELQIANEFDQEFIAEYSVFWYTRECFLYKMLNKALWIPAPDILYKLRYFLRHLNQLIQTMAAQQWSSQKPITVFRGQGMPTDEFNKLKNDIGGLLSFRSFLSTSLDRDVAFKFAEPSKYISDQTSIIFVINIDPSIQQCSFIHVGDMSYYQASEQEILFTMGTVFRIDAAEQLNDDQWEVRLSSSNNIDMNLAQYMDHMRKLTRSSHPLISLVKLTDEMGQYKIIDALAKIFIDNDFPSHIPSVMSEMQHVLGSAYLSAGNRTNALKFLQEALNIYLEYLPSNDPILSSTYNNIGSVYHAGKDYDMALTYHQLALDCQLNTPNPDFDASAVYSMNIATVYEALGRYDEVSAYQKRALKFRQQHHGENDLTLLDMYSAIGRTCYENEDYEQAEQEKFGESISYYQKALDAELSSLPDDHPTISISYFNLSTAYAGTSQYDEALQCAHKAVEQLRKSSNPSSSELSKYISQIGNVLDKQKKYSEAIGYFKESLDVNLAAVGDSDSSLANDYNQIAETYLKLDNHSDALIFYEKALKIEQNTLIDDHPSIAITHFRMSRVYLEMSQYDEALKHAHKAVEQLQKRLTPDASELGPFIYHVGNVLHQQGKYSEAIFYYQEALPLIVAIMGDNNPQLATIYYRIANVYGELGNFTEALFLYESTLQIELLTLPSDEPIIATTYESLAGTFVHLKRFNEAIDAYLKGIDQLLKTHSPDHKDVQKLRVYVEALMAR